MYTIINKNNILNEKRNNPYYSIYYIFYNKIIINI